MFIPDTEVRLLNNVPLSNTYEHQMTFDTKDAQTSFFYNKANPNTVFTDFTYVKSDSTIQVGRGRDELYTCNYLMFRNENFTQKWFYAFITKLEYINPNTTKVHFEIDVYQTWLFEMEWKPSYIVREHTKRWNADGTPVVNTVDEGLDYGSEYETVALEQYVPFTDVYFMVIVCKNRMDVNGNEEVDPSLNGVVQPLTYYIHPFKLDGSVPSISIDGVNQSLSTLEDVLRAIYKNTKAVNNVVSLYVTEHIGQSSLSFSMSEIEPVNIQDDNTNFTTLYAKNIKSYKKTTKNFGNKYDGFASVDESKLLMHPYTVTLMTDMKGNAQEIKNEYIDGEFLAVNVRGSLGTSNKVSYTVANYLKSIGIDEIGHGIINESPNDVPIITDMLSAYLQGNRNQLQNQMQHIAFSSIAGTIGSAMGTVGSALARNPVGVVGGLGEMAGGMMNSYFQIGGLLAKQKDLSATPPQLSQMGGNTSFDYGNGISGVYIIKKQITAEYRKKLSDYFKMYGYKVNELKVPNLKSRQHFNFIQTAGANIIGNIPHDDLQKIKSIFNNGVTLWHGDWVGDYSRSNGER